MCYSMLVFTFCLIIACKGNKWLQQKIPACRPVWMAKHVFLLFIIVGVVFIALGIGFLVTTARVSTCLKLHETFMCTINIDLCDGYVLYVCTYAHMCGLCVCICAVYSR